MEGSVRSGKNEMDSKTLKTSLKIAVENIKAERYTETVKICKDILDSYPGHSRALVFLGKAAEGLGKNQIALESYEKATENAEPGDMLPWQGLCAYLEKHSLGNRKQLTQAYWKLLELYSSNEQKRRETRLKLCLHLLSEKYFDQEICEQCEKLLSQFKEKPEEYKVRVALAQFYLKSNDSETKDALRRHCEVLWSTSEFSPDELHVWESYSALIYQAENDLDSVLQRIQTLIVSYPDCPVFAQILAEIYCQLKFCESQVYKGIDLTMLNPGHLSLPVLALFSYILQDEPIPTHIPTAPAPPSLRCCAYLVQAQLSIETKSLKKAGEFLENARKAVNDVMPCISLCTDIYRDMISELDISLNFKLCKYSEVITLCTQLERGRTEHGRRKLLVLSHIYVGNLDKAEEIIQGEVEDKDKSLWGYLMMKKGLYKQAYDLLSATIASSPTSPELNLWLGETCYLIPDRLREAAKYLLMSAKLDPMNEQTFLFLGLYYNKVGDTMKGLKCIKKSYSLNPADDRICIAYVDQLMTEGSNEQAMDILVHTTKLSSTGSCKWAWFRLGNLRVQEGSYTEAVNCFQQALRADSKDSNCWECLADSYVKRGSYTSAISAFEKSLEIHPDSVYSKYQIALTKYRLGLYEESLEHFLDLHAVRPDYAPALKGLGDVHLCIAKEGLKNSVMGKAVRNINSALLYLTKAAVMRPDLNCVWKSLGDTLTLTFNLPADCKYLCPSVLTQTSPTTTTESVDIDRATALLIAARCYSQCTHLNADNAHAWHDLAVSYFYQSKCMPATSKEKERSLLTAATQCCLKSISLDVNIVEPYTCLGALYLQPGIFDPLAAQHYLIVSVERDQNNVQGWTNLATLYLMQGDVTLAHEVLKIAQSADPKYTECWTGQAIVAELIGHEEAMDLFRHTTDLGRNPESVMGYAHWVLKTLLSHKDGSSGEAFSYSIERLEAVPVSCYSLGQVVDLKPEALYLNAYGLLLERLGLYKMAAKALARCVGAADDDNRDIYRSNLARVLCWSGELNGSLYHLGEICTPSVHDTALWALVYYKSAMYDQSFQKYSELLKLIADEEIKSHVYAALGMVSVKRDDADSAKTFFFQCYQCAAPSVYGLAALCSFALLTGEGQLAVAALTELLNCADSDNALRLKSTFSSYMHVLRGEFHSARNELLKSIRCYPLDQQLHNQLLVLSLTHLPDCRESVLRLSHSMSSIQDLIGAAQLSAGHLLSALRHAQKSAHMYPGKHSNWLLLMCTVYAVLNSHDMTSHVTDDITSHVTDETVSTLLGYNMGNEQNLKESLLQWMRDWLAHRVKN